MSRSYFFLSIAKIWVGSRNLENLEYFLGWSFFFYRWALQHLVYYFLDGFLWLINRQRQVWTVKNLALILTPRLCWVSSYFERSLNWRVCLSHRRHITEYFWLYSHHVEHFLVFIPLTLPQFNIIVFSILADKITVKLAGPSIVLFIVGIVTKIFVNDKFLMLIPSQFLPTVNKPLCRSLYHWMRSISWGSRGFHWMECKRVVSWFMMKVDWHISVFVESLVGTLTP